jgi:hypothetical protein
MLSLRSFGRGRGIGITDSAVPALWASGVIDPTMSAFSTAVAGRVDLLSVEWVAR